MFNHTYRVGDVIYQQTKGLELTTAVSRPFMFIWDRLYLESVKKAGLNLAVYERYVDDSNQLKL